MASHRILFVYSDSSAREVYVDTPEEVPDVVGKEIKKIVARNWSMVVHISDLEETEPTQL